MACHLTHNPRKNTSEMEYNHGVPIPVSVITDKQLLEVLSRMQGLHRSRIGSLVTSRAYDQKTR